MEAMPVNMSALPSMGLVAAAAQTLPNEGLPSYGTLFPPKPFDIAQRQFHVWDSWYKGDVAELQNIYIQQNMVRPTAWAGGLVGRLQRFFWGRPNIQSAPRVHVPAAADLSRTSADLLFAEPPTFLVDPDDTVNRDKAQSRLDLVFGGDETTAELLEGAELCSALGGTYLRLWWDKELADHVMVSAVRADTGIPQWRNKKLVAVTFWTLVSNENGVWMRHLERHESGRILHGLYMGDQGQLGQLVPLTESPETAWVAQVCTVKDNVGIIPTGVDQLTAAYVPNVRPNKIWALTPGLSPLGGSDYGGLEPLFDALDQAFTSWMSDIDLGKARVFVDESMLVDQGPGQGSVYDGEQTIFTKLRMGLRSQASDTPPIQSIQFNIRWQEHSQTCAEILNTILRGAGISTGSFADTSLTVGVPTATEINSRDNLSERTRTKKVRHWRGNLSPLSLTALQIDADVFGTGLNFACPPVVKFPSRSMESPSEMAQTLNLLALAQAISTEQKVIERHPDWTGDEIAEEVARIKAENMASANTVPDQQALGYDASRDTATQSPFPMGPAEPGDEGDDQQRDT